MNDVTDWSYALVSTLFLVFLCPIDPSNFLHALLQMFLVINLVFVFIKLIMSKIIKINIDSMHTYRVIILIKSY